MGLVSYLDQLGLVFEFTLGFVSGMFIFFLSYFPGFSIKVSDGNYYYQSKIIQLSSGPCALGTTFISHLTGKDL